MVDSVARTLSTVSRWAVVPTIRRQSVAEHVFQVLRIAAIINADVYNQSCEESQPELAKILNGALDYVLYHDDSEVYTGDIPGPAKRLFNMSEIPDKRSVRHYEISVAIAKLADVYEALIFCNEEASMGNRMIKGAQLDAEKLLVGKIKTLDTLLKEAYGWGLPSNYLYTLKRRVNDYLNNPLPLMELAHDRGL